MAVQIEKKFNIIYVLLLIIGILQDAEAAIQVEGSLKGYFLSANGSLAVHELALKPHGRVSEKVALYPLKAGYYLHLIVSTDHPLTRIKLASEQGQTLWEGRYPRSTTRVRVPYPREDSWLGIRGTDIGKLRLKVRYIDGSQATVTLSCSALLGKILPLEVDWLDFIRMAEIRHLIRTTGNNIFPNFTLDDVPFALKGAGDQWVLINHPRPPKSFIPYTGRLPKLPYPMRVYTGKGLGIGREEAGGWLLKVNDVWTAGLKFYPYWWVLTGSALIGFETVRQPASMERLEAMVHEACHVWWFQRQPFRAEPSASLPASLPLSQETEWEYLMQATEARDLVSKERIQAFLYERERRRQKEGIGAGMASRERWLELVEGVATYIGEQAIAKARATKYRPLEIMAADEDFRGYEPAWDINAPGRAYWDEWRLRGWHYAFGLAQIRLLDQYVADWKSRVLAGRDLEELLKELVRGVPLPSKETVMMVEQNESIANNSTGEKNPIPSETGAYRQTIRIWLHLPDELVRLMEFLQQSQNTPLQRLNISLPGLTCRMNLKNIVFFKRNSIYIKHPTEHTLQINRYATGTTRVIGSDIYIEGNLTVFKDKNSIHIRFNNKPTDFMGSISDVPHAQSILVFPPGFLNALASGKHSMSGQEGVSLEGTASGIFLNAATTQFEWRSLPIPDDQGDYYYIPDEEYRVAATLKTSRGSLSALNFILKTRLSEPFGRDSLARQSDWHSRIYPRKAYKTERSANPRIKNIPPDQLWLSIRDIEFPMRKMPPTGQLNVKLYIKDMESIEDVKPIAEASNVSLHNGNIELEQKTHPAGGDAVFPKLVPGQYTAKARKNQAIAVCAEVSDTVTVFRDQAVTTSLYLYVHKPIKGRALEQSGSMQIPLPGAKASLWKGTSKVSGDYDSDAQGNFAIPALNIDTILAQYGNGSYVVKVTPPSKPGLKTKPASKERTVFLKRCQRQKAQDACVRGNDIPVEDIVFTCN